MADEVWIQPNGGVEVLGTNPLVKGELHSWQVMSGAVVFTVKVSPSGTAPTYFLLYRVKRQPDPDILVCERLSKVPYRAQGSADLRATALLSKVESFYNKGRV